MFFYLSNLLFSGFLQFKAYFLHGQNNNSKTGEVLIIVDSRIMLPGKMRNGTYQTIIYVLCRFLTVHVVVDQYVFFFNSSLSTKVFTSACVNSACIFLICFFNLINFFCWTIPKIEQNKVWILRYASFFGHGVEGLFLNFRSICHSCYSKSRKHMSVNTFQVWPGLIWISPTYKIIYGFRPA